MGDGAAKPSGGEFPPRARRRRGPRGVKEANEASSSGSWKGKRAGSGGAAVVRRVCAFVGGPWSSRIPQCGTFAFGSKRVPQPRFAGAEADLRA